MKPWKKTFVNPRYPMSNRDMQHDRRWGGAHPRLRSGWWYHDILLPRVLPERRSYVDTTEVAEEIVKVDKSSAAESAGTYRGYLLDPLNPNSLREIGKRRSLRLMK